MLFYLPFSLLLRFFDRVITPVATFGAGHLMPHGCRVSKIATYGGGSSWKFGLVMPSARSLAPLE